jgi:ATP-dependent DNA helicase HFM1/MER3
MDSASPAPVSLHLLPDRFRSLFPFSSLNHVQSKAFPCIYYSDQNYVLSAPTGSGKTAVFELAICRLIGELPLHTFKVVYLAPTRALCSERLRDWEPKFRILNITCVEYTGDDTGSALKLTRADIIISTPEKWDVVTRKWKEHEPLMRLVKLFLIDEVHTLKETRGATLEAVVSRMRRAGKHVRFVALSATVPNVEDIAEWLKFNSTDSVPANYDAFTDEHRPVPLQKFVYGVASRCNEFVVDQACNVK